MRPLEEINARNSAIARKYIEETPPRERLERRLRKVTIPARCPMPYQVDFETFEDFLQACREVCLRRESEVQKVLRAFDILSTPEDREWFVNLNDLGWTQFPSPPAASGGPTSSPPSGQKCIGGENPLSRHENVGG